MRRFKIGFAHALVWAAVSLALWCGCTAAFAESYFDFTFSGQGVTASGVFNVTGVNGDYTIQSISGGSVSGFGSSSDNGAMTLLAPGAYTSTDNGNKLYYINTPYVDGHGVAFTVSGGSQEGLYLCNSCSNTFELDGAKGSAIGTLSVSPTATPAPLPGAGLLSYLVLGLAGLLFYGKTTFAASARLFAPTEVASPQPSR
jgi:hypothetical protein